MEESINKDVGDHRQSVDHTMEAPYSGIAQLSATFSDITKNSSGTGFLTKICGTFCLVTARHTVKKDGCELKQVVVEFGNTVKFEKSRHDVWTPKQGEGGDEFNDYALIMLDIKGDKLKGLSYFVIESPSEETSKSKMYIVGYPGDKNESTQWKVELTDVKIQEERILYRDATYRGMSGSPLFIEKDGNYVAIGIHVQGFKGDVGENKSVKLTKERIKRMTSAMKSRGVVQKKTRKAEIEVEMAETKGLISKIAQMWPVKKLSQFCMMFLELLARTFKLQINY